jgi:hypothetical protein
MTNKNQNNYLLSLTESNRINRNTCSVVATVGAIRLIRFIDFNSKGGGVGSFGKQCLPPASTV